MDHADEVVRDNRRRLLLGVIRKDPGITLERLARRLAGRSADGELPSTGDVQLLLAELEGAGRIFKDTCPGCRRPRWMVSKA